MALFLVTLLQVITPRTSTSGKISIPPDSMLAATVMAHDLRVVPELPDVPRTASVDASDQLYQTARSYKDMDAYFDRQFRGFIVLVRHATQTSTAWHVERPDGKRATIVVRNTTPTSFEIIEVVHRGAVGRERGSVEQNEPNQPEAR